MPKVVRKRKTTASTDQISMVFDIEMVDALIKYVRCDQVSQPQVSALYKLLQQLDFSQYNYNQDILDRLNLDRKSVV